MPPPSDLPDSLSIGSNNGSVCDDECGRSLVDPAETRDLSSQAQSSWLSDEPPFFTRGTPVDESTRKMADRIRNFDSQYEVENHWGRQDTEVAWKREASPVKSVEALVGSDEEHVSKETKSSQLNDYLPREGEQDLEVFPVRNAVPGENPPYELETGRQTTAPRRTRRAEILRDGLVARAEAHDETLTDLPSGMNVSSADEMPRNKRQSPVTRGHPTSRRGRRSQPGQEPRSQGTTIRRQQRSSRHERSNPSASRSMVTEQNDLSQQPPQPSFQSFDQEFWASQSSFPLPQPATTIAHVQAYQSPGQQQVQQQAFSSLPDHYASAGEYYQSHLQSYENFGHPNHEPQTFPTDTFQQTSQNFDLEGQFIDNEYPFPSNLEGLDIFSSNALFPYAGSSSGLLCEAQSSDEVNTRLPSLSTSSMTPPSDQPFSDPINTQPEQTPLILGGLSRSAAAPAVSKPGNGEDEVEWPTGFQDLMDFESLG